MKAPSVAISHTPWVEARVKSYARLCYDLGAERGWGPFEQRTFADRARNWEWSETMWRWAAETGADHALFLQDDVIPAPNFWSALQAMLLAVPDQLIGLEAAHPAGKRLALEGHRFYTTADYLVGPGYVFPRALLEEFLTWRRDALRPRAVEWISEDSLIGLWCAATGRRVWHPVPTIIDHDTSIESTYGNGAHRNRRPSVTWRDGDVCGWGGGDLEDARWWLAARDGGMTAGGGVAAPWPPHLGTAYAATPHTLRQWLRRPDEEMIARVAADTCPMPYARWQ